MTNIHGKTKVVVPASNKRKGPGTTSLSASIEAALEQVRLAHEVRAFITTALWDRFFDIVKPTYMELTLEFCSTFYLQCMISSHDKHSTITFRLGSLVRHMSVPDFGAALGIYTNGFMGAANFPHLHRHSIVTSHIFDLAYFIALAFHHQTDRHRKDPICLGHYVIRLVRHFGFLDTPEQSSTLTLVGQMPPQGISSMIHIRMIKRRCGVDPTQYRLFQSNVEHDPEDFIDDVPPYHEDPPQPPHSSHRPIHYAASSRGVFCEVFMSFR
ncbi:hypothetical protein PVK06_007272 [Gossypium arboreum]|uniref:Uncharacterized protein n=1 Tax=Gossypium arboreum TaxID=29729 RepID=A0ABR0QGW1_GOSAR|nr:hypothetical protein PVK06_007272 [Gossypium arboreum]